MTTPGRREQHKADTRRALQQAAQRLFETRGFQATTIRDITKAAGVGERTFFRYFPSKEQLLFSRIRDLVPELQRTLRDRPIEEAPCTALLNAVLTLRQQHGSLPTTLFSGPGAPPEQPERTDRHLLFDLEQAVTDVFEERLHDALADPATRTLHAATLARAGLGALRTVLLVYAQLPEDERTPERMAHLTHEAFAVLAAGTQSSRPPAATGAHGRRTATRESRSASPGM